MKLLLRLDLYGSLLICHHQWLLPEIALCRGSPIKLRLRTSLAQNDIGSGVHELALPLRPVHLLLCFLKPFPSLGLSPLCSSLAATTGRAAAPFVLSSPSPLPATSASSRYARPFSFLRLCETEHPKP